VLSCVGRGLCGGLISRPKGCYQVSKNKIWKPQEEAAGSPRSVEPQEKEETISSRSVDAEGAMFERIRMN